VSASPESSCCAPSREEPDAGQAVAPVAVSSVVAVPITTMVGLPGGTFAMGSDDQLAYPDDGEGPVREVDVAPFAIDSVTVSNARFGEFVDATAYVTDAERFGDSFVFGGLLPGDFPATRAVAAAPWWREVLKADWCHPEGPQSDLAGRSDHPVVHVSWTDAIAYCEWAGVRLLTEAEWEYAARGGLAGQPFPWGSELEPGGEHRMNVWQGHFPKGNTQADGYLGTAPVMAFPPNNFGLHNMTGNVWEWTADTWTTSGAAAPTTPARKALRGGSYLCHASYCRRYRVSARMANTVDSTSGNTGFRVARRQGAAEPVIRAL
jgi:formylglycine-generating enzyme